MSKKTWITLDKSVNYLGFGIEAEELYTLDINLINNQHYWGIYTTNENGEMFIETVNYDEYLEGTALEMSMRYCGIDIMIQASQTDKVWDLVIIE